MKLDMYVTTCMMKQQTKTKYGYFMIDNSEIVQAALLLLWVLIRTQGVIQKNTHRGRCCPCLKTERGLYRCKEEQERPLVENPVLHEIIYQ